MSVSKFNAMWRLMIAYKFELDPDLLDDKMICILCKGLMIDACRSVCGCQFCYKCISDYFGDVGKYCPGNKDECSEDHLSLTTDVWRNERMNEKISKIEVKCPNVSCQSQIELSKVEVHLRTCTKQPALCPYVTIGCNNEEVTSNTMINHMSSENLGHSQLLMEWVGDLKNEVSCLEENVEMNSVKLESFKNESKIKDIQIEELRKEIECTKEEFWLREQSLEEELRHMRHIIELKLSGRIEELRMDETPMRKFRRDEENANSRGRKETDILHRKIDNLKVAMKQMKDKRLKPAKETHPSISENRENVNHEKLVKRKEDLNTRVDLQYLWRIYEWSRKLETMERRPIFSDHFYLSNYKLCLRLYINGDQIGLFCFIMKGENDENLQWPLRRVVTLSILNQQTMKAHKSASFHYDFYGREKSAFDRPKVDMNYYCIGIYPFTLCSSFQNKDQITMNNSILVSCSLGEPPEPYL